MFDRYSGILFDPWKLPSKTPKNHEKKIALTALYNSEDAILFLALFDSHSARNVICWRQQKSRQHAYSGTALYCRLTPCKQSTSRLEDFQVKTMFKQHVNPMIQTWFKLFENGF